MRGECSGKMRSTPSPCTMRRTVKVARMPSPRWAITRPEKICTRSFSPSRMRWCTSTWSPISNADRSVFSCVSSTRAMNLFFMVPFLLGRGPLGSEARRRAAAGLGLFAAPAGDGLVVAAEQHLRHLHAAEDARPRVLRVLQPPRLGVRLLRQAGGVAQHARHVADDGVDHLHRRHLAAVADEVA